MIFNLRVYFRRHVEWSRKTFGEGRRTIGLTKHIEKECAEIRRAPDDLEEWADVIILGIDGFWRAGGTADDLDRILQEKQVKNVTRTWPTGVDENTPIEHVRDDTPAPAADLPQTVSTWS
jgi:hypothetical protein